MPFADVARTDDAKVHILHAAKLALPGLTAGDYFECLNQLEWTLNCTMRIVSLVPSWTEYVVDLGCAGDLVGRTKFCVRAGAAAERIPVIGGTKRIHLDRVEQLKPDLVIASKEENTREDVEACRAFTHVLVTDVRTIPDAFEALEAIGDALEKATAGVTWRSNIEKAWGEPRAQLAQALYAIWQNPLMVAGHDTYIHAAMNWWGIGNAAPATAEGRYPNCKQSNWMHWPAPPSCSPQNPTLLHRNTARNSLRQVCGRCSLTGSLQLVRQPDAAHRRLPEGHAPNLGSTATLVDFKDVLSGLCSGLTGMSVCSDWRPIGTLLDYTEPNLRIQH